MDATCWHLRHVAVGINALSRKVAVDEALIWQASDAVAQVLQQHAALAFMTSHSQRVLSKQISK